MLLLPPLEPQEKITRSLQELLGLLIKKFLNRILAKWKMEKGINNFIIIATSTINYKAQKCILPKPYKLTTNVSIL